MAKEVIVTAGKVKRRKKVSRIVRLALLFLLLFLIIIYIILKIIYNEGSFTVTLDSNRELVSGLAIYDTLTNSQPKRKLYATPIKFMDNISYKWIPENVNEEAIGSHNGQNYIAYTFFVENQGNRVLNYWYEVIIDDVIRNVDEAIRVRIYRNDEEITYAKLSPFGKSEEGTTPFRVKKKEDKENVIILEQRKDFNPYEIDRITVVIWIEGDDPECQDNLIDGEIKMHMNIIEEHIEQKED